MRLRRYDNGATFEDVSNFMEIGSGMAFQRAELETIQGAALGFFCQEHLDKVD